MRSNAGFEAHPGARRSAWHRDRARPRLPLGRFRTDRRRPRRPGRSSWLVRGRPVLCPQRVPHHGHPPRRPRRPADVRRILRAPRSSHLSLYYGALAVYFCVLARFSDVGDAHEAAWYVTYLSNVRIATHGWPSRSAIDQFWSLAIEEQFYLVWPVIVLGRSRATVVRFCLAIFGIALLTRIGFGFAGNYDAIYVLTPCRADALAAGAMAAVAVRSNVASSVTARLVVISAVVWLTVVACVRLRYWTDQPAVYAIGMPSFALLCASAVAYLASVPSNNRYARALSVAPLRALGKYSYAIYVFQQGAMIAAHRLLSPHLKTVPSVLSIVTIGGAGSALSIVAAIF